MRDFLFVHNLAINPAAITCIRYDEEAATVNISIGGDVVFLEGDAAKYFFDLRPKQHETTKHDNGGKGKKE